ncbi:MAG: NUDIX domain-containing protein [Alphaproteobacteria bacterium]|nr:NUDIX domain-containing protein [Alphaproteobacteria bacterium]
MAEFWDVYDINGNKTGKIVQRDKDWLQEGEFHMGASAFITDGQDNFLIQQRSFSKKQAPGKWSNTGGSALAGEDKTQCILREIYEELGIKLTAEKLKFLKSYVYKNVFINVFVAYVDKQIKIIKQTEEVEQTKWVSRQQLQEIYKKGEFFHPFTNELLLNIR